MDEKHRKIPDELRKRMPWRYALAFAQEWAIIGVALAAIKVWPTWYVFFPAVCVLGTRQHAISWLAHDGAHCIISRYRRVNDAFMNLLFFWPLGACGYAYREWHLDHHRHTRDELDPEYSVIRGLFYRIPSSRLRLRLYFITDLCGLGIPDLLNLQWQLRPKTLHNLTQMAVFWIVFLFLVWWTNTWLLLAAWLFATATVFQALSRVRAWSEHQGVEGTLRFQPSPLSRLLFFPYNTWCHYEHHLWPNISCFNLPKAREFESTVKVLSEDEMYRFFSGEFDLVQGVKLSRELQAARGPPAKS